MSAGFLLYVWGCGTGLPVLDRFLPSKGVPFKTFDFIRVIKGLGACVWGCVSVCVHRIETVDNPNQFAIIAVFPGNTQGNGNGPGPIERVADNLRSRGQTAGRQGKPVYSTK